MIPLPKPRGFWDYALFVLILTSFFVLLFWLEVRSGIGWADVLLGFGAAALCAAMIVLARQNEKATWILRPTWRAALLVSFGTFVMIFGAVWADLYILHRTDMTASNFRHDVVLALLLPLAITFSIKRNAAKQSTAK